VPRSGCCDNAPVELQRCIAPCGARPTPSTTPSSSTLGPSPAPAPIPAPVPSASRPRPDDTFPLCAMPATRQGCVKLGGGTVFYYEGWVCPVESCPAGYCSSPGLDTEGRCAITAQQLRDVVASGQARVLEGSLPPP
jgi:hypothetical protein